MVTWRTNRKTRKPYKTVLGRSISDLQEHPHYVETVAVGVVRDLVEDVQKPGGVEWEFTDRDTDVEAFLRDLNVSPDEDFGAAFVKRSALSAGDVGPDDIYFITGTADYSMAREDHVFEEEGYEMDLAWMGYDNDGNYRIFAILQEHPVTVADLKRLPSEKMATFTKRVARRTALEQAGEEEPHSRYSGEGPE